MRYILIASFLFFVNAVNAQQMSVAGTARDTATNTIVENAVVVAVRFSDSTLISFSRSDKNGFFKIDKLPLDTYVVIVSHPTFGDQQFIIMGNKENLDVVLKNLILPPKTISLQEVVIVGYSDPMYYKGDTLIYNADSFAVKPNAVVEDLLKKLPGIKVDAQGKIYSQGRAIDKLLVDGDEFFGADPTVATRNLDAKSIASVQVYDKANTSAGGDGSSETLKVMNLQLKEDAKKGYFGKISGGTDFSKFYENQFLANRFRKKSKLSVFALGANTPNSQFSWQDQNEYGLDAFRDWDWDEEWGTQPFTQNNSNSGLPQTLKAGIYFSNKFWKGNKIDGNYTYNPTEMNLSSKTQTQYFFSDTSYKTNEVLSNQQNNVSHQFNFQLEQELDSMSDISFNSKIRLNESTSQINKSINYFDEDSSLFRSSNFENITNGNNSSILNTLEYSRRYQNKKKRLYVSYTQEARQNNSSSILQSLDSYYFSSITSSDSINQKKNNSSSSQSHRFNAGFNLPITKKIFIYSSYTFTGLENNQDKKTLDFQGGDYNLENALLTNNFQINRITNQASINLRYEVKSYSAGLGTRGEVRDITNTNLINNSVLKQNANILLPFAFGQYTFKNNSRIYINYNSNSKLPSIDQLQPIPDNSTPNQIKIGNPDLKQTFGHLFRMSINSYKPVSGRNIWGNIYYITTNNDFSNSVAYDNKGQVFTQTINVNGNYRTGANLNLDFPFWSKKIFLSPALNLGQTQNTSYINNVQNKVVNTISNPKLDVVLRLEKIEFLIGTGYSYTSPTSTINANSTRPFSTINYNSSASFTIKKTFELKTDANYSKNNQRFQGYNIDYLIWNASLTKSFFKDESLQLGISVRDILNQNINVYRTVQDNMIMDVSTNAVGRYFLVKLNYKFKNKAPKQDEVAP